MKNDASGRTSLSNPSLTAFHDAVKQMERGLRNFDFHIDAILADPRLSKCSVRFLKRTWYAPRASDALTLAQRPVREALTKAVTLALLQHCERFSQASRGSERLRLLSTCPDRGYCDYAGGRLQFSVVERHFNTAMQRRDLEGLALIDHALIDLRFCGHPDEIGLHFHAVCWPAPDAAHDTPRSKARKKCKKRNKYGLAVVQQDIVADPLTTRDVALLAHYISKLSAGLKEDHDHITRGSQTLWGHEHALRALEIYSQLSPWTALISVGPMGDELKSRCLQKFNDFLGWADEAQLPMKPFATRRQWRRVYRDLGLDGELRPVRIN